MIHGFAGGAKASQLWVEPSWKKKTAAEPPLPQLLIFDAPNRF
jgi:hypothetical protein